MASRNNLFLEIIVGNLCVQIEQVGTITLNLGIEEQKTMLYRSYAKTRNLS